MTSSMRWRTILVIVVVLLSAWKASYTFRFFSFSDDEKAAMPSEQLQSIEDQSLRLGLDLQGGMHLVLQVEREDEAVGRAFPPPETISVTPR